MLFTGETEGDPELERQLIEAMHDRRVDGIVLASMYTRKLTVPKALLDGPAVLLNALPTRRSGIPSVLPDEIEAGRTAAGVLLKAGHTAGIYLVGAGPQANRVPKDSLAAVERLQGIKEALGAGGVRVAGAVACPDWQPELGYSATRQLLREGHAVRAHLLQRSARLRRLSGTRRRRPRSAHRRIDRLVRRRRPCVLGQTAVDHRRASPLRPRSCRDRGAPRSRAGAASRRTAADPQDPDAAARAGVGKKRHGIATSPTHNGAQLNGATLSPYPGPRA